MVFLGGDAPDGHATSPVIQRKSLCDKQPKSAASITKGKFSKASASNFTDCLFGSIHAITKAGLNLDERSQSFRTCEMALASLERTTEDSDQTSSG